jgi:hypothetical protein
MFHAHKTEFAEKGWMGLFMVKDPAQTGGSDSSSNSSRMLETKTTSGGLNT